STWTSTTSPRSTRRGASSSPRRRRAPAWARPVSSCRAPSWRSISSRPCPERAAAAPRRSATLERRRALLDERADALAGVFGLRADVLGERLELERAAQIGLLAVIERTLGQPDGDRRARGDLPGELVRGRHQLFRRVDSVHDPEPQRLLRVDDLAGEDQLARLGHSDQAW